MSDSRGFPERKSYRKLIVAALNSMRGRCALRRGPSGCARCSSRWSTDRKGLLRDITEICLREKINVTPANTLTRNSVTRMAFTLEVRSLDVLSRALSYVKDVKGVLSAGRR